MTVNRFRDLVERVGWTAIQAFAATAIIHLANENVEWGHAFGASGIAALIAALKVLVAQNVGGSGNGDAISGGVIQEHGHRA